MAIHPTRGAKRGLRKAPFSTLKAKKVLREKKPTLRGKRITRRQRGLLGLVASGKRPTRSLRQTAKSTTKIFKGKRVKQLSALKRRNR